MHPWRVGSRSGTSRGNIESQEPRSQIGVKSKPVKITAKVRVGVKVLRAPCPGSIFRSFRLSPPFVLSLSKDEHAAVHGSSVTGPSTGSGRTEPSTLPCKTLTPTPKVRRVCTTVARMVRSCDDPARSGEPRVSAPCPGSDRSGVRTSARCADDGPPRTHVAGPLLKAVPGRLRRDALRVSHDPPDREGNGSPAFWNERDRRLHGRRLYLARLVQFAIHRAGGRYAKRLPHARAQCCSRNACLCREGAHAPEPHQVEQFSRSREQGRRLELVA